MSFRAIPGGARGKTRLGVSIRAGGICKVHFPLSNIDARRIPTKKGDASAPSPVFLDSYLPEGIHSDVLWLI